MTPLRKFLTKERHLKFPYLGFYLRLPLIDIGTHVMTERLEMYTYDYIAIRIKVWRWESTFRLYEPGEKRYKS